MKNEEQRFRLPGKVDSYLSTLNRLYEREGDPLLREIVVNGVVSIQEGREYDNWNGGQDGHAITFTVTEDMFLRIMERRAAIQDRIRKDLNKLDNSQNEYVCQVVVEMQPTGDDDWRMQTDVYRPIAAAPTVGQDSLARIWGGGHIRVFLSHKVSIKRDASALKKALARCGVASFVAHEDIEPTEEWQREIERALFSMDALVALLSEDFHDSLWTDQEVGVAIGRGVPVIPIRLDRDPYGFMGKRQALTGCDWSDTGDIAGRIFQVLFKRLPGDPRLFECALSAYTGASTFADSAWKLDHYLSSFKSLDEGQVTRVLEAFRSNKQNRYSFKGKATLQILLKRWTGEEWQATDDDLIPAAAQDESEIPF